VVLLCQGTGLRLNEASGDITRPGTVPERTKRRDATGQPPYGLETWTITAPNLSESIRK